MAPEITNEQGGKNRVLPASLVNKTREGKGKTRRGKRGAKNTRSGSRSQPKEKMEIKRVGEGCNNPRKGKKRTGARKYIGARKAFKPKREGEGSRQKGGITTYKYNVGLGGKR